MFERVVISRRCFWTFETTATGVFADIGTGVNEVTVFCLYISTIICQSTMRRLVYVYAV